MVHLDVDTGKPTCEMEADGPNRTETRYTEAGVRQREKVSAEIDGGRYLVSEKKSNERGGCHVR